MYKYALPPPAVISKLLVTSYPSIYALILLWSIPVAYLSVAKLSVNIASKFKVSELNSGLSNKFFPLVFSVTESITGLLISLVLVP